MLLLLLHTVHVFILIITNRERELARHDGVGVGVGVREWRRDRFCRANWRFLDTTCSFSIKFKVSHVLAFAARLLFCAENVHTTLPTTRLTNKTNHFSQPNPHINYSPDQLKHPNPPTTVIMAGCCKSKSTCIMFTVNLLLMVRFGVAGVTALFCW